MFILSYILFYKQSNNREAGEAVLRVARAYDRNLTVEKSLRLENKTDETFTLPTVAILARVGLIWVQPIPIPIPIQIYSPSLYFCLYRFICNNISATDTDISILADI